MEEQESEKTSNRFRKREKAPTSSFGWRWLFPAFLLAAVTWSVFLLVESGDELLNDQSGETLGAIEDLTAPGFEAFVEQTWSMVIATEDKQGDLVDLVVGAVADSEEGGGSLLIVSPALVTSSNCAQSICDLAVIYGEGGLSSLTAALVDLFNVGFTEEVLLTPTRWTGLVAPVNAVEVTLESPLMEVTDEGIEIVQFAQGDVNIQDERVADFFSSTHYVEPTEQMNLSKSFWKSWLEEIGENGSPREKLPDLGLSVVDFLAVVGAAETGVTTFPIATSESSVMPNLNELESIVVDLFPFPIAAVPGDRLTVRLMNGTGDFSLDSLARKHVISAGAEIVVVGNMETFDFEESKVIYRNPLIAQEVESLGRELGFIVEFDELISPVSEVTVVIGADFLS
ncbi:MAG: Uncharacterised protein [Acidimicrobiales bacterium AG-410-I20]|nr:MAG: Uncharacterised protein [Acidimicrobiales bacterium AG-410-I20]